MKKALIYIGSIAFLALAMLSCTAECYVAKESKLGISFLDSISYKKKNISSLTVLGLDNDSVLYYNANVSAIYLPLHINNNNTKYRVILPTRVAEKTTPDTILLNIDHTPMPQLISEECGCAMFHSLQNVALENNTYNSKLDITNPNVINDDKETNIKILH